MMVPKETIIETYKSSNYPVNMSIVHPWLLDEIPKCSYCEKQSHFCIKFKHHDSCSKCKDHFVQSDQEFLCKLNCDSLYYELDEYKINKNYEVKASYTCDKDDCFHCGRRVMYSVEALGFQVKLLPPKPKSMIQKQVESFIENNLIVDENGKIECSQMIQYYKLFFHRDKISLKRKKELNREITNNFNKLMKRKDYYYYGYSLEKLAWVDLKFIQ